jgi:integral membrane protein
MQFLKFYRVVAFLEGSSLLILLGIAMPLKYYFDVPKAVSYVGMTHGFLFMAYFFTSPIACFARKLSILKLPVILLAGFVPFGSFIMIKYWFEDKAQVD